MKSLRAKLVRASAYGLTALMVAAAVSLHGGQKIQFSNPETQREVNVADLKNQPNLAPQNLAGFKRSQDVPGQALLGVEQVSVSAKTLSKRQQQAFEERNSLITPNGTKKAGQKGEADDDKESSLAKGNEDSKDEKSALAKKNSLGTSMTEINRMLNGTSGDSKRGAGKEENEALEKGKLAEKDRSGGSLPRFSQSTLSGTINPADFRGGYATERFGVSPEKREAAKRADMDNFSNLLNPGSAGGLGANRLGEGGLGGDGRKGPGLAPTLGSGQGPAAVGAAPFSTGPRAFDGRQLGGQSGFGVPGTPGLGATPGLNPNANPIAPGPKPAVLQFPKRNQ